MPRAIRPGIALLFLNCALAAVTFMLAERGALHLASLQVYDSFLRSATPPATPNGAGVAAVVDIDEHSLAALGQWPWPRTVLAQLAQAAYAAGARVIAFDILFAEPDRTSPAAYETWLVRQHGPQATRGGIPDAARDHDLLFADALRALPTVTGCALAWDESENASAPSPLPPGLAMQWAPGSEAAAQGILPPTSRVVAPIPALLSAAPVGSTSIMADADGSARGIPLIQPYAGHMYPGLALAAFLRAQDAPPEIHGIVRAGGDLELTVNDISIPLDRQGNMMIRHTVSPGSIPVFSASQVLRGTLPPGALAGRVVFIGTSALGLADRHRTPLSPAASGVMIHAAALDTLWSGAFIQRPAWTPGAQMLLLLATAIWLTCCAAVPAPAGRLCAALAWGAGLYLAAGWLFTTQSIFLSPCPALLTLGLGTFLLMALHRRRAN